jgi:AraC-like DNA-binding protein
LSPIDLQFRTSPVDLAHAVVGFVQRRDRMAWDAGHELPMANPMIQFMLGGDYVVDGETMPRAALWGPTARAALSRTDGPAEVFIVVLTAAGAARLARSDLALLLNRAVDLGALDSRGWRDMPERVTEAGDFEQRIDLATDHLRKLLIDPGHPGTRTLAVAGAILGHRLRGPVTAVAAEAGLSSRGLYSAFMREVGCGPKRLMRIARLQRVLRALHPRPWSPGTPEDAFLEYVDQAHLDRDFLDLTRLSRSSYIAAKSSRGDRLVHTVV